MTLTLNIDENLIQETQSIGNHQTEQAAITEALKEYIRYHKQRQLIALFGTIDYDETYDYKLERSIR